MSNENTNSYVAVARLINANISGPTKCMLVEKLREDLVRKNVEKVAESGQEVS